MESGRDADGQLYGGDVLERAGVKDEETAGVRGGVVDHARQKAVVLGGTEGVGDHRGPSDVGSTTHD